MPNVTSFVSKGGGKETVVLTLEEYETLRLLNHQFPPPSKFGFAFAHGSFTAQSSFPIQPMKGPQPAGP